ncbi:MAG: lysine exporter LysO family protein [Bacteroidaceae bacterium]|nr:lysine exporter LysO family protein [Bacteroidaceae bacterium]
MKGSLIIIGFFLLGVACGVAHLVPAWITDYNFYVLCALLFAVGMSVGIDGSMVQRFRALNPRLAWLPVCSILGTLAGSVVAWLLVPREVTEVLAVGSGFGYYSLSSILITEYSGAELGTVALLANITRELFTLLAAPLMVRFFGTLAPIAAGGATAMDTTLPIISQTAGREYVPVSIYCGFVTDFSVPFLVTLFLVH